MCSLNLPDFENLPKHVPRLIKFGFATEIARRMDDSET